MSGRHRDEQALPCFTPCLMLPAFQVESMVMQLVAARLELVHSALQLLGCVLSIACISYESVRRSIQSILLDGL